MVGISLSSSTAYTQDFDTLANSGTSGTLPTGWAFAETGTSNNATYTAGTGSGTTGDTYSFGSAGSTDRALGGLQSGSLIPIIGAQFSNDSAQTITSLLISYTGEQWRLGTTGRADRLDFQISFDATSLTTGTWADVNALDFNSPVTTGAIGALNGNLAANRTAISATITGQSIAAGQTFWIRWTDLNATGADDGLAIDDFSLTPSFGAGQPTLSISDATVTEGNNGTTLLTYTVTASAAAGVGGISFDIATAGTGTATAGTDFVAQALTGQTIAEGQTSYTFSVVVNGDTVIEPSETVVVNLANVTGATIADGQGVGTIVNDDYGLSISDATVTEGDAGTVILTYTVTASSAAPAGGISFDIATADGTATAGVDYVAQALTGQTIAAGQTSYTFSVVVNGDTVVEPNETVLVNLSNVVGAVVTDGQGVGTIVDNDFPTLSISDASVSEGDSGTTILTYTVTSSAPALAGGISFDIATADGTATAGSDYVAQATTGTIAAGQTTFTFSVVVNGDVSNESNETVLVNLSNVTGATLADAQGVGTILNDDGPIRIFSETFGNFLGAGFAPTPTASQLDSDIWRVAGLSDNLTPAYGATLTTGDFARGVINGAADPTTGGVYSPSADHALVVQPTGSDFDLGGFIEARVQNSSGKTAVAFDVGFDWAFRNSGGRADNMQFSYSTDGTNFTVVPAAAFVTPTAADASVAATFSNRNETVSLTGLAVADGGFLYLRWTHLDGATGSGNRDEIGIDNVTVDATTSNLATATVANISLAEGDAGTTNATFTIVRSSGVGAATIDYTTANGSATAGSDYVAASGTVSFADGETSQTVTILVNGDTAFEAAETFFLNLSNPSNVLLPSSQASATITNDDNGAIAIYDIQGAGHTSALVGQFVSTTGIVTAVASNGFYLQDPTGDGNARTSDGIFVFTSTAPTVVIGDGISLTGTVTEFDAGLDTLTVTQITAPTVTILTHNNTLPAAVLIGATGGILPPTQSIDSDGLTVFNPEVDGIDFYETLEGMRVTIQAPVVVSNTNNFGETFVVASGGTGATGVNARGGITISAGDNNPERIQIDNDSTIFGGYNPSHTVGDRLADVTGVFNYAFQSYELLVTEAVTVTSDTTPTRETSTLVGDATHVTFASFNIENADPTDPASKFTLLGNEIKFALNTPDIIALQEVQDADGAGTGTNYSGTVTAQRLIDAIIAAGGPTYSYIEVAPTANNTTGGEPNGNIRNGFLYNAERVSYVNGSVALVPGIAYNNSRNPLVADFSFNGQVFTTVSVHSTSRGGSDAFYGDIQPPAQAGDSQRTAQADTLRAYINDHLATDPNHQYIIGGDFNGYYYETALQHLAAGGVLTNLYDLLPSEERYSYIFDGNEQAFDNILVTGGLRNNAQFDVVHYNSEQLTANQATDHDQPIARIEIPLQNVAPTGTDASRTILEDASYTFATADFGFADSNGNTLAGVRISTLPAAGTLFLDSDGAGGNAPVAVIAGQTIAVAEIAAGHLTFVPAADANGAAYGSFTFQVQDDGGVVNGGVDLDQSPNGFTITVTPVNDAPVLTGLTSSVTFLEDTVNATPQIIDADVSLIDPEGNFDGGKVDVIGLAPQDRIGVFNEGTGAGQIGVSGSDISYGGVVIGTATGGVGNQFTVTLNAAATSAAVDALIQHLTYANVSDTPIASRGLTIRVTDSEAAIGSQFVTVTVTAQDDAPTAVADVVTTAENIIAVVNVLGNDTDPDGGPKNVVSVDGNALSNGQSVALASGAIVTLGDDGTLRYDPNGAFNGLNTGTTGADSFSYALNGGSAAVVSVTINGVTQVAGDSGDNTVVGTAAADNYNFSQGGNDSVSTGDGNDAIFFGGAFNQNDSVDGGAGNNDQLGLQGDYSGANALTLGAGNLTGVEVVSLLAGFDYTVTTLDDLLTTGQRLTVFGGGLGAGDNFSFDGSAETSGSFLVYGGFGTDVLTGGGGNDGFSFGAGRFNAGTDVINGGSGTDQVALNGYTGAISGANFISIETIVLASGSNSVTLADDWTLAGQSHTVFGSSLSQRVTIDGSAESDGNLALYGGSGSDLLTGGAGNDMIVGGAGADIIRGGLGADMLRGDGGTDTFILGSAAESTGITHDTLIGFDASVDTIDLPTAIIAIDSAITVGTLSAGSFDSDLGAALAGLGANHAITFTADQGDLAGHIFLVADTNGIAGYQAGEDAVFELINPAQPIIDTTPFI